MSEIPSHSVQFMGGIEGSFLFPSCVGVLQITNLNRDPASGNALQEISFWLHLESALNRVQARRASPEVHLTMDILKAGKRFQAVVGFDTDTRTQAMPPM